jgi:membrane fusion protein (multidrug efflux system)
MVKSALILFLASLFSLTIFLSACEKQEPSPQAPPTIPATIVTIEPVETPVVYEFVGQAESSRKVEIRARVDGFLDKQSYQDGALVKAGQTLFELDKKPFQATLQQVQGELELRQAQLGTAEANLQRIRPLAEQDAVSKKDLDDAEGLQKQSKAAVLSAEALVREAKIKLGYATISTPVTGQASKAVKHEGSYIPTGQESLLTYVAQLDPIWVNFSVSENQILRGRQEVASGRIKGPEDDNFAVEVVFADGTSHPERGRVNFAEPSVDPQTGTMLIRAELANPKSSMRPGQFVRVRLHGSVRPDAILLPQTAVMQGAKGHFVWVANQEGRAEVRVVEVGSWHGNDWFINSGLQAGEQVIIDNLIKLQQGIAVVNQPVEAKGGVAPEKKE